MTAISFEDHWSARAAALLQGRRITDVVYMPRDQARALGWRCRAPLLTLQGGLVLAPYVDAHASDAGGLTAFDAGQFPPLQLEEYLPRPLRPFA
jgi:hypothetical protein